MKYNVEVAVGDWATFRVEVEADSGEDAKAEAEELVKAAPVEAVYAREAED